jgi:hypothetical protein
VAAALQDEDEDNWDDLAKALELEEWRSRGAMLCLDM